MLALAILSSLGAVAYISTSREAEERFTEFYMLGPAGRADGYPRQLAGGESGTVILAIVNRERERVSYRVDVGVPGEKTQEIQGITLEDGERWERSLSLTFAAAGPGQRVDFLLYKLSGTEPYRTLYLRVDVVDKP